MIGLCEDSDYQWESTTLKAFNKFAKIFNENDYMIISKKQEQLILIWDVLAIAGGYLLEQRLFDSAINVEGSI